MTPLTPRERDVLGLLSRGVTYPRTAQLLGISIHTTKAHAHSIRLSLGARNTAHAVRIAFDHGILR